MIALEEVYKNLTFLLFRLHEQHAFIRQDKKHHHVFVKQGEKDCRILVNGEAITEEVFRIFI